MAIICDEEPGTKLYPLTKRRSKSALPIAAHYRIIDFVVSNCINSDITKIYALTQFNSTSLNSHMSRAYSDVGLGKDGFVEVLTSYQSTEDLGWFKVSMEKMCVHIFLDQHISFSISTSLRMSSIFTQALKNNSLSFVNFLFKNRIFDSCKHITTRSFPP